MSRFRDRVHRSGEAGFSLVEVVVSLLVIAVVTTAAAAFVVNGLRGESAQKERQQAVFVADQQLEKIKALPTSEISTSNLASKLVEGRTQASVQALWATAAANNLNIPRTDDETSAFDYDSAGTSDPLGVKTQDSLTINGLTYTIYNFIDVCWLDPDTGNCGTSETATTTMDYRVTVDVTWTSKSCSSGCSYSDSTIIDPSLDATFNTNISTPAGNITAEANNDGLLPTLANGQIYTDSALYQATNTSTGVVSTQTCKPNPAGTTTYSGTLVTVTGTGFLAGMTADLSGTSRDSGAIVLASIYQPSASVVEFCMAGGDQPGSYTITLINSDKGHFPIPITEVPFVQQASGYNSDSTTTTLTGGGIESGATVSVDSTSPTHPTWSSATVTAPPTTDTTPNFSTVALAGFNGPSNGAKAILDVKNPDNTTATFTMTAPNATASTIGVPIGQAVPRTISGAGFRNAVTAENASGNTSCTSPVNFTSVSLNSIALTTPTVGSTTYEIDANCAVGQHVVVSLYNTDGGTTSESYLIDALPVETSLSPSSMVVNATKTITVTGTGFLNGAAVQSTGVPSGGSAGIGSTTVGNSTTLTFTMTPTVTGTYTFKITNGDGGVETSTFSVNVTPAPIVGSISPSAVPVSSTVRQITVSGSNFQSGATIQSVSGPSFSSTATTFGSASSISFNGLFNNTGNYVLDVMNPDGGVSGTFTVVVDALPVVTSATPNSLPVSASTQQVVLAGSGFQSGATIQRISGPTFATTATTFTSASSIKFSGLFSTAGTYNLEVVNADGGVSSTFSVVANPLPTITGLSPTSFTRGTAKTFTITGTGFLSGTPTVTFTFNGTTYPVTAPTYVSATSITFSCNVPTSASSGAKTATVKVTNPDGGVSNTFSQSETAS